MINDNPHQFLDSLSYGAENEFVFRNRRFMAESCYLEDKKAEITVFQLEPWVREEPLFYYRGSTMNECLQEFLKAPIFDGHSFWEAEQEFEWLYG